MTSTIEPEWLDHLPPEDARAQRSRGDLGRLNRLMNHVGPLSGLLRRSGLPGAGQWTMADLGAGDGSLTLRLMQRLARGTTGPSHVWLVDRNAAVTAEVQEGFQRLGTE